MFCPECRSEYREGFTECSDCNVRLVSELPPAPTPEPIKLVTVLTTGNAGLIAVAKSLLEAAEILYLAKGEGLQDLEALGRIGTGFNPVFGPVQIQVAEADAEEARRLLQDLDRNSDSGNG